jgi:hypothetical protein
MSWLVNVYAEFSFTPPAKALIERSPMFKGWEAVGGTQVRITLSVPETAADDAESACNAAKEEIEKRLTLLTGWGDCAATEEL